MAKKRKQVNVSGDAANSGSDEEVSAECENRRGRTILAIVGKAIKNSTKVPLQWNHNNVPTGPNRGKFANYIGVVARERVSINYREWDDVPQDKLDEVFEFIARGFPVPEECKSYVLGRASIKWRTFKARLRRDWMYDSKGENKNVIIRKPPSIMYDWISQSVWDNFIETYTDPKFKELSDLNRERAKKRTSTYRGGRKGYLYFEEEIVEELRKKKVPPKDVPRHLVWIRAHSRQENGDTYFDNPADFEVAQAIKALEAQQIRGEIDATGRNDILARALKTPEHGGSVRGVGSGVTNKQYFGYNKPTPPSQLQTELLNVKAQLADVTNNQKLLFSYLMSGESNLEQLKQLAFSNANQVMMGSDCGGSNQRMSNHGSDTRDTNAGCTGSLGESCENLQGANFKLVSKHNKHQEKDVQTEVYRVPCTEPQNGVLQNAQYTQSGHDLQGAHFQLVSEHNKHTDKDIQIEPYRVSWPENTKDVPENEQIVMNQPFPKGADSVCSLAIENEKWVDIVAVGEVYVPNDGEQVKHHLKPVPSGYYRVSITEEVNPNALLPCPEGEIRFVCQGKGQFFIWPINLIFPIQKTDKQPPKEFSTTYADSPSSQTSSTQKYRITPADKLKVTTTLVQVFKDVAIGMKKSGKIKSFTVPARVFQYEQCVSLDYIDMLDWCFQREIGSSHMSILMMYLSELVHTEGISGLYGFCDCNYLSPLTPTEKNEDDRCDYLSRVFACNDAKNKNQLFFAPYYEGRHWMLAVICPWIGLVHWLDPNGAENEPRQFAQTIINKGIIKFSMEHRKDVSKIKKNPYIKWKNIECPRQPLDSKDCGYYVCRYMIEIIESRQMIIPDKYFDKVPPMYSQQLIDEVRERWISFVSRYPQPTDNDEDSDGNDDLLL